jgi:hypothetical protein
MFENDENNPHPVALVQPLLSYTMVLSKESGVGSRGLIDVVQR